MQCIDREIYESNDFVIKQWDKGQIVNTFHFTKTSSSNTKHRIDEIIYMSDTLTLIKCKIASHCLNTKNIENIYIWGESYFNEDDKIHFLNNVFKKEVKLKGQYINDITRSFFDKKYFKNDEMVTMEDFQKELSSQKTILRNYDFVYTDFNDYEVFLSPNPFLSSLNKITNMDAKFSYANTLLFKLKNAHHTLHFCLTDNINKIYTSKIEINKSILNFIDQKGKFYDQKVDLNEAVDSIQCRMELLYFRVLPYSHDIDLDMKMLFHIIKPLYDIPIISYRSKYTNEYKLHKFALSDMNEKQIKTFNDHELKMKDSTINRSYETIVFYIKMFDNIYFYFLLSSNGSYKIKYKFNKSHSINIKDIYDSFDKLRSIFDTLDDNRLYIVTKDMDIFNSKNVEIIEYNTHNLIALKQDIHKKTLVNNLKKSNPFFQFHREDDNVLTFQFTDTNNFYNTDSITAFVYKNIELEKNELIQKIQDVFKVSSQDAEDIYNEKKNDSHLNISKKGKNIFVIRSYDTGVNIKLTLLGDSTIRIHTTNTHNVNYQSLILFYIINYCTQQHNSVKKGNLNKISPVNEDQNKINFGDVIDFDENDFDFNMDDLNDLNIDLSSPIQVNIETDVNDISEYDDYNLEDNQNEDYSNSGKKTDYTTFVLERLYKADPKLFLWKDLSTKLKNYSSKCGAVDYRQPIVITKKEKDYIDKNHPGSYTGHVQTGSTPELKEKNFYICPKIWCKVSKISITEEEYNKYGKKCPGPYFEEPMFFPKKGSKKNYFINKDGSESHWPSLLNKNKHPRNLELPCCGKKPFKQTEERKQNSNYISNISNDLLLDENQYGNLPTILNDILNKKNNCIGIVDAKSFCFVRTGVKTSFNSLSQCIEKILNIKSLDEYIANNMKIQDFILLNHGYSARVFSNTNIKMKVFEDENEYKTFQTYFTNNMEYIQMFNLQNELDYIKSHEVGIPFDTSNILTYTILREYLLYKSFINFKNYIIQDTIEKDIDELYHMLTFSWLNKQKYNFIIIEVKGNDVFFLNPKYFDFFHNFDETKLSSIILKIGDSYEYISNITQKPRIKSKELLFTYDTIQNIIPNVKSQNNSTLSDKLMNSNIQHYVLSSTFKCTGVIIDDNFIPTGKYINLSEKDIKITSFVYSDVVHKFNISKDVIKQYINVSDSAIKKLKDDTSAFDNLRLFSIDNKSSHDAKEVEYKTQLYEIAKIFDKHEKFNNTIKVLNHDISNFTQKEKLFILRKILHKFKFTIHDGIDIDRLLHDLLNLPMKYIIKQHKYDNYKSDKTELRITYDDLINLKLIEYHKKFHNNFKVIETSIEDNVETIEYMTLDVYNKKTEQHHKQELALINNKYKRVEIKPAKMAKMFPNFEIVDKSISYSDLISLSHHIDSKITIETFGKYLNDQILKDYMQDKNNLYAKYKQNINFVSHKIDIHDDVNNYIQLINKSDYHYALYELEVLSKLLNHNIIIIGRDTSFIKDGLHIINSNANQYIFFIYNKDVNKYSFRLIVHKDTNTFVFNQNDFNESVNKLLKIFAS